MITIVGSLNLDLVVNAPKIPRPGETIMGENFKQIPGGKGGNQADAVAKLAEPVNMIGCVGKDDMGRFLLTSLESDGVNVKSICIRDGVATGIAAIIVEESGNNAITVAPGANFALTVADIEENRALIENADILLTQLETKQDVVEIALRIAKEKGKKTILNPAPAASLPDRILELVDIITPNETELEVLSGHKTDTLEDIQEAAGILLAKGIKEVVVTIGAKGAMYVSGQGRTHYNAYKVKAIDTTAAGDCFNGALAVALSKGNNIEEAILFAMKAGAISVTKRGAQPALPHISEIESFASWYEEHKI